MAEDLDTKGTALMAKRLKKADQRLIGQALTDLFEAWGWL
jgi:hypothetical protein